MELEFDSIHNYYERLVFNEIQDQYLSSELDEDQLVDMACLALNEIKPRYIRHDVDMSFFMSAEEHQQVRQQVIQAVRRAYAKMQLQETNRD
ncbi:MAG: late competence development ComFB family protein [Methyloprofundus sp.]|nr:late competence development ComFB family protein [Methyloprofundus sp.]